MPRYETESELRQADFSDRPIDELAIDADVHAGGVEHRVVGVRHGCAASTSASLTAMSAS